MFAYCRNNPVMHSDPDGDWVVDAVFLAVDIANFKSHPSLKNAGWVALSAICFVDATGIASSSVHIARTLGAMEKTAHIVDEVHNAAVFGKLKTHLRLSEKYGTSLIRELGDGRIRYYGEIAPATNKGEMVGRRLVREWNPKTNKMRTWHETLDTSGRIRQIRPVTGSTKTHYMFDRGGRYIGKR